jgi:hypothetical protein
VPNRVGKLADSRDDNGPALHSHQAAGGGAPSTSGIRTVSGQSGRGCAWAFLADAASPVRLRRAGTCLPGCSRAGGAGGGWNPAWSNGRPAYRCRHGYSSATVPDPARPTNGYVREDQITRRGWRPGLGDDPVCPETDGYGDLT